MKRNIKKIFIAVVLLVSALILTISCKQNSGSKIAYAPRTMDYYPGHQVDPYSWQVAKFSNLLSDKSPEVRAGAVEALGFLRAFDAANKIAILLADEVAPVRKEAVMALGWCGGRAQISSLILCLKDEDWTVRQSAAVSLYNLTGMDFDFDALGSQDQQSASVLAWERWWREMKDADLSVELGELLREKAGDDLKLKSIRALGAMGGDSASEIVSALILPYLDRKFRDLSSLEVDIIQAGLLALGRLQDEEGYAILLRFIEKENWARYAADALGDFGNAEAVDVLLEIYPQYSRKLEDRVFLFPDKSPDDDRAKGDNKMDRMHETPYAIAYALSRLITGTSEISPRLQELVPFFLLNFPSDYDGAIIYQIEADQLIHSYLLEKAGYRNEVCRAAFRSANRPDLWKDDDARDIDFTRMEISDLINELAKQVHGDVPYIGTWLSAFCTAEDADHLIPLLRHDNGWIRINAAKALMFNNVSSAIDELETILSSSPAEASYGYSGVLEHAEYDSPSPRWREAYIMALGRMGSDRHVALLEEIIFDEKNAVGIQYAAALALDEIGSREAIKVLRFVERDHPFSSVSLVASEALYARGHKFLPREVFTMDSQPDHEPDQHSMSEHSDEGDTYVFIKGNNKVRSDFNGQAGVDPWRQTYSISNSGPTMRVGNNLYLLQIGADGEKTIKPLTSFTGGMVSDCEVSWDAKKIYFARRLNSEALNYKEVSYKAPELKDPDLPNLGGADDPWWHIWEIRVDGTGLRQLTFGPYHDVAPAELPDGRIVFSSSRTGLRDEYHGFPAPGLSVMNPNGTDIRVIGFNAGADRDPAILHDGRIVFSRLDIFYSRLKTEVTVQSAFPDGTRNLALYGPESRPFWKDIHYQNAAWTMRNGWMGNPDNRNRVLRLSQAQSIDEDRIICASSGGLVICGPGPYKESLVPHDRSMAVTSPFPLGDNRVICSATPKHFLVDGELIVGGSDEFLKLERGPDLFESAVDIDLAIYEMNIESGEMVLLYNDPETADFEARPVISRKRPIQLAEQTSDKRGEYTARLFCNSAFTSRIERVTNRGKFVRVIEGQPQVSRHSTQHNLDYDGSVKRGLRWKNHGGTIGRVLGTTPLASDGSFYVEIPADRLVHIQILDSDRRVLGNQTFWLYARPGETRSCVGCHEDRNNTAQPSHFARAAQTAPVSMLPYGDEFSYLAKAWMKGWLPDEIEERTRTVRAINMMGRQ